MCWIANLFDKTTALAMQAATIATPHASQKQLISDKVNL